MVVGLFGRERRSVTEAAVALPTLLAVPAIGLVGRLGREEGVADVDVGVVRVGRAEPTGEGLEGFNDADDTLLVLFTGDLGGDEVCFDVVLVGGGGASLSWDSNSGVLVNVRSLLSTSLDGVPLNTSRPFSSCVGVFSPMLVSSSMFIVSPRVRSPRCTKLSILLAKY